MASMCPCIELVKSIVVLWNGLKTLKDSILVLMWLPSLSLNALVTIPGIFTPLKKVLSAFLVKSSQSIAEHQVVIHLFFVVHSLRKISLEMVYDFDLSGQNCERLKEMVVRCCGKKLETMNVHISSIETF
eukprot:UN03912